jgi:hypothetical protein
MIAEFCKGIGRMASWFSRVMRSVGVSTMWIESMERTIENIPVKTSGALLMLRSIIKMSPWFWVSIIYGAQTLGAIIVTFFFKVGAQETWLPIALLGSGATAAAFLGYRDRLKTMTQSMCWFPLALYALFIFSLSHRSFSGAELSFRADYFHLVEFCTLALFLSCFFESVLPRGKPLAFFCCVVASGVLFGLADEFHQSYIPGRDSNLVDIFWDAMGLSIGCGIYLLGRWLQGSVSARFHDGVAGESGVGTREAGRRRSSEAT